MLQVPLWWVYLSGVFFALSILWTAALTAGVVIVYRRTLPLIKETQMQVRRVTNQVRTVATKASQTADIVHAQTQHLLGNAESVGSQVTKQARTFGAALTGLLVAVRVVNFVRKII
jgi:hypothetical protein